MVAEPLSVAAESADVLQDMMAKAETMAAGYRDNDIPEGELLGEAELQGQQVKWKKPKSMVRSGNTPLPERFEAFDRFGKLRMLPTAQMGRMLSKPAADSPGVRAFHTHSRGATRADCKICPPPKVPIEETCQFCLDRSGGTFRKKFYTEGDAFTHKSLFHELSFAAFERAQERAERAAAAETQTRLANAMILLAQTRAEEARMADPATPQGKAVKP
jgi:hypothetical protein